MNKNQNLTSQQAIGYAFFAIMSSVLAVFLFDGCTSKAKASAPAYTFPVAAKPAPEVQSPMELAEETIMKAGSFSRAVELASTVMTDTREAVSAGTTLLAWWAVKHMTLADVRVAVDETSSAKVKKDSEAERGKRLCATGQLVQIHTVRGPRGTFTDGLLLANSGAVFSFLTVGSSGSLTEGSDARVCGVVTGLFDYSMYAGGTGHSVQMVGMFDIPENRKVAK